MSGYQKIYAHRDNRGLFLGCVWNENGEWIAEDRHAIKSWHATKLSARTWLRVLARAVWPDEA